MNANNGKTLFFIPDELAKEEALARTTHLGISAHHDDIEIMAYHGILECFGRNDKWFGAIVVTDGAGSPRDSLYADYTDEQMRAVRKTEQKKAAVIGEYSFLAMLDHPSSVVKNAENTDVAKEIADIVAAAKPDIIYTHNLADKHDTHVATALRVIAGLRMLPEDAQPQKLYACEVWRDLDWLLDERKVAFDVSAHENLAAALLGVFDSQICGGKRYDLATLGRRRAHATYHASHGVDQAQSLIFAFDMTALIKNHSLKPEQFIQELIEEFKKDAVERLHRLS